MTDKNLKDIDTNQENILKVGNVEVFMRAELGKTTISLKNAMEYDEGSIVMLDNLTQDPVDIYVDDISKKLEKLNYKWDVEPFYLDEIKTRISFIQDPDGNSIELIEKQVTPFPVSKY